MRHLIFLLFTFWTVGISAQETTVSFQDNEISFSGDHSTISENNQVVEFTGNVQFTTDIVEIEKADKIVYDRKTKTFTISGFKELRLHGKKKLASDFGPTTLKIDLGDCIAYLKADTGKICPEGKGNC